MLFLLKIQKIEYVFNKAKTLEQLRETKKVDNKSTL